jgi:small conductance mechanosensitive channel
MALLVIVVPAATAQDASDVLPAKIAAQFDEQLAEIAGQKEGIAILEIRAAQREGVMLDILMSRRDRLWTSMFRNTVILARQVSSQRDAGRDVSAYWQSLVDDLSVMPQEVQSALQRVEDRAEFATDELEVIDFVFADQEFFREVEYQDELYGTMVSYIGIADDFGLDASEERDFIVAEVSDHAANLAVFLSIAQDDVSSLRATAATLPDNAEVADWLSAANTRIRLTAEAMQDVIGLMTELRQDTRLYRRQLLTATGEITTDVLDVGLVASLAAEWSVAGANLAREQGLRLLFRGLFVVLILFAFWQLAKFVRRMLEKGLGSSRVRMSNLLRRMIVSTARNIIIIVGLFLAISQLGISLGPLLAGLGIAGFIIGFALQDTLANFASGIMILLYRPFDVGDVVEASGVRGRVSHMSLVNTTFMTLDNQRLIVPNNMIWSAVITNVTAQRERRIDLMFGISYEDDVEKAERVLREIVEQNEAVLDDPEPVVKLHELADSSVNFTVRPWVKTTDYWDTYWDITKAVKLRFDEEGISIPYPQREVHVIEKQSG